MVPESVGSVSAVNESQTDPVTGRKLTATKGALERDSLDFLAVVFTLCKVSSVFFTGTFSMLAVHGARCPSVGRDQIHDM